MNHFKKSNSSFNSSYGFKKLQTKSFKSGKTFKSPCWRPYNSQFYADGTPKIPGRRKDGTPRMKGIGRGRRY
ncbi:MAG: hypothetical protein IJP83_02565 [Mycoplasma sp.]|nr:hypothetical protein [Mycoplasma sp.]